MQFTKLRLLGFKSFVDPTEMAIAPGITGVVGPNGCGKSNLLEALRWVMGESRPKSMRGGGMEDVIFAGAETRPARNFAEVTLSIDNADRLAPAAFNNADTLEIVRRITRDAGSAYKVNGKECRARDVQMLFADASTGAHSPALVRQGQISELINAKPKARRRILEEAAGISGLYQRRHEAELKLNGTESNLMRVEDVLEQLDVQLRALARQARQAARYRQIAEELRRSEGLLLYRRWREATEVHREAETALREAVKAAAGLQGLVTKAIGAREAAERQVPPLREEEAISAAILQRLQVEQATLKEQETRAQQSIVELQDRITLLEKDLERETGLSKDAGETIATLEWEAEALAKAGIGHEDKLAAASDAAADAASALQAQEAENDQLAEDAARLAARHQSAKRRLEDARALHAKLQKDAAGADKAVAEAEAKQAHAAQAVLDAADAAETGKRNAETAEATLIAAEAERTSAQNAESDARVALSEADGEAKALRAETQGLQRLVERDQGDGDQLLSRVKVKKGYEAALGAALADDLKAAEVDGDAGGSGWRALPPYDNDTPLPEGAARLTSEVVAPPVLARRLQAIGLVGTREEGARLQPELAPGQRLVSLQGDLWRWDGYRLAADDASSSAALRLQQMNRLEELQAAYGAAAKRADIARGDHGAARAAVDAAQAADKAARAARRAADEAAVQASRGLSRAQAEQNVLEGRVETLRMTVDRLRDENTVAQQSVSEAEAAIAGLDDLDVIRAELEAQKITLEAARMTMMTKRSIKDDLRREGEARVRRAKEIEREKGNWIRRRDTAADHLKGLAGRIEQSEADLEIARTAPAEFAEKSAALAASADKAKARLGAASDALALGETALREAESAEREAERNAAQAREERARAEAVHEAARAGVDAARERLFEETGVAPQALLETLEADPDKMPDAEMIEADVARLKRQRDALGSVNLRAEEDAQEIQGEFNALNSEKTDLEEAVKKLRIGIANLNSEGRERLLAAFDTVNKNFTMLFKHLFGGGEANLVLVESDDPLEAGLEIMCQPPGKKLSTMSLLSGGEQTLTAMSLIFAVFLANPSPICVLDEVDAPLDDANVTRFCDLLDEMAKQTETRFLIITHHAVTMARMDRLFGVTMGEKGVSQLVSVDLRRAEEIVEG